MYVVHNVERGSNHPPTVLLKWSKKYQFGVFSESGNPYFVPKTSFDFPRPVTSSKILRTGPKLMTGLKNYGTSLEAQNL